MAEIEKKVVLTIDTGSSPQNVGQLKEQIKQLRQSINDTSKSYEENQKAVEDLDKAQRTLKTIMKGNAGSMEEAEKVADGLGDSYDALVNQMGKLKKEWRATGDEAKRFEIGTQINKINDQLKEMDASIGNNQRNVGNYKQDIISAFQSMGGAASGMIAPIQSAGLAMKALSANPIIAIAGAMVVVIKKIIDGLKSSEENMNAMRIALAPLNAGTRLFTNIMQSLGKALAKAANWLGNIAEKLGLFNERMKEEKALTEDKIALIEREREVKKSNAKLDTEISQLKTKIAAKDKYTNAERLKFLEDAFKKEKKMADDNIEIARTKYNLLVKESEMAGNSAEENEALVDSYVELQAAEKAYEDRTRELTSQRVEAINALKAENAALEKNNDLTIKSAKVAKTKLEEQVEVDEALLEELQNEQDAETEILLDGIDQREYYENLHNQVTLDAAKETARKRLQYSMQMANGLASILGSIADTMNVTNEKEFKRQQGLQIAEATITTITGALGAFMQAVATIPAPFGAIIGGIQAAAATAAGVAQIASIKRARYSENGSSGGSVTAPSASVPAPSVPTPIPVTRNLTGASEEERLNRMAQPMRAYVVESDLEGARERADARSIETSF